MTRCTRCQGCFVFNYEEWFCLNCGYRPENVPTFPPLTVNPERSWASVLCLCGRKAIQGKSCCIICQGRVRGKEHGKKISEGMAQARNRA